MAGEAGTEGADGIDLSDIDLDSIFGDDTDDLSTEAVDEDDADGEVDDDSDDTEEPDEGADETEGDEGDEPEELYEIKVGGRTRQVNLEELRSLAQMGDDYTRKTQVHADRLRLADAYEALQAAFAENPEGTLAALREAYHVEPEPDLEQMDPLERQVFELQRELDTIRQDRVRAAVQAEIDAVKTTFDLPDDWDSDELLQFAHENQIRDLKLAYRALAHATAEATAAATASKQQKVAAKRQVPATAPKTRRAAKTTAKGSSTAPDLDESIRLALEELRA